MIEEFNRNPEILRSIPDMGHHLYTNMTEKANVKSAIN